MKTEAQRNANKNKIRSDGTHFDTMLGKSIKLMIEACDLEHHFVGKHFGVGWSVQADFLDQDLPKGTAIPKDVMETKLAVIKAMDYYTEQKGWSAELMKGGKMSQTVTAIVRPAVLRKIKDIFWNYLKKEMTSYDTLASAAAMKGAMDPQFYQLARGSNKISTACDYGLCEIRVTLEGCERIWALDIESLPGGTLVAKQTEFAKMKMEEFFRLVKARGFYIELDPFMIVMIPSRFAICSVASGAEVTHGVRMLCPTLSTIWPLTRFGKLQFPFVLMAIQ